MPMSPHHGCSASQPFVERDSVGPLVNVGREETLGAALAPAVLLDVAYPAPGVLPSRFYVVTGSPDVGRSGDHHGERAIALREIYPREQAYAVLARRHHLLEIYILPAQFRGGHAGSAVLRSGRRGRRGQQGGDGGNEPDCLHGWILKSAASSAVYTWMNSDLSVFPSSSQSTKAMEHGLTKSTLTGGRSRHTPCSLGTLYLHCRT